LRFLANGKFLALLTLLFGVGLELQYRSARRRGARWPGWYLWRAALLLVEGLLHYVLVFEFDVLMSYAVTSVLVTYLIGRSDRAVRAWMIAAGALHVALVGLLTVALMAAPAEQAPVASDLFASGSYPDQVAARLDQSLPYRVETIFIVPLGVVLVPARLAAAAAGAFEDGARGARLRARLMVVGLGVGVPLNVLSTFAGADWFLVDRYLMPPLVALGLLALVTTLVHCGIAGPVRGGLTAVGRTALSCYVLQNVVASVLCYGWGLGLATRFADARPWWVVGAWAGISVLNVALASWWLRRFDRGPPELVWHCAYRAPQRILAPSPDAAGRLPDRSATDRCRVAIPRVHHPAWIPPSCHLGRQRSRLHKSHGSRRATAIRQKNLNSALLTLLLSKMLPFGAATPASDRSACRKILETSRSYLQAYARKSRSLCGSRTRRRCSATPCNQRSHASLTGPQAQVSWPCVTILQGQDWCPIDLVEYGSQNLAQACHLA
jgi:uncharacterized protein